MSGSGKETGSAEDETLAGCTPDLGDISSLNSQMQMISDSLAACKRISNYRSAKRDYFNVTETGPESTLQTSGQALPSAEETASVLLRGVKSKTAIFNNTQNQKTILSSLFGGSARKKKSMSQKGSGVDVGRSLGSWSLEGIPRSLTRTSDVGLCAPEALLEFKNLTNINPGLVLILTGLFKILWHCKSCSKCNKKIRPSIPWILSRITKLINYVAVNNWGYRDWANDRVRITKAEGEEESCENLHPRENWKEFGTLEKVEAVAISEDHPGVQVLLQVKIFAPIKRFFYKVETLKVGTQSGFLSALQLEESATAPLIQILRLPPSLQGPKKLFVLEEVQIGFGALLCRELSQAVVQSLAATTRTAPGKPYEETRNQVPRRPLPVECGTEASPATKVQDLYLGASDGREMQVQRVKELEGEVKGLKDLMVEVHKNQVELSRVLLEKGLWSRGVSMLEDPTMAEEESEVLEKMEFLRDKGSLAEALQLKVNDLKRKCYMKNKMIVTLLKGLRSDVPQEWWEELVDYIFDDESDPEKVNELIRQTSVFLLDGEKGSTVPPPTQNEGHSLEEEPKTRGAAVKDALKNVFIFNEIGEKRRSTFVEDRPPLRSWALPPVRVPDPAEPASKRLENQISLLSEENDRLRHHVDKLGEILKTWLNETNGKENVRPELIQDTLQSAKPRKIINLTIRFEEKRNEEEELGKNDQELPTKFLPKFPSRRCSGNGFNCLDNSSPVLAEWARALPKKREKMRSLTSEENGSVATPYPSGHEICRPHAVSIPAGPSTGRHFGAIRPIEKCSAAGSAENGTLAALSKDRELGTIPENEHADWAPEGMSETIQRLRARVKSIHEDFSFLELKNNGINKLLDRLMEDVVKKSESFEKTKNS